MIIEDPDNWPPPYVGRGANFSLWDKNPSPVVGYRNNSHWTKDLTVMRYAFSYGVRSPERMAELLEIHLKLMRKTDPHRPLFFLFRMAKRLFEGGMPLEQLAEMFVKAPKNTITRNMGSILKRELECSTP